MYCDCLKVSPQLFHVKSNTETQTDVVESVCRNIRSENSL